jgi:2-polyprenyl-3-methyl-5-hydroxy-6-metoxy-1,4-benzoquinol methylase
MADGGRTRNERCCNVSFLQKRSERDSRQPAPNWTTDRSLDIWWHSFEFPSGERVLGVRSKEELSGHLARFAIADDLIGQRVLDIGAWDGWFSFECERRGAEIVAIDCWDNPRFR